MLEQTTDFPKIDISISSAKQANVLAGILATNAPCNTSPNVLDAHAACVHNSAQHSQAAIHLLVLFIAFDFLLKYYDLCRQ